MGVQSMTDCSTPLANISYSVMCLPKHTGANKRHHCLAFLTCVSTPLQARQGTDQCLQIVPAEQSMILTYLVQNGRITPGADAVVTPLLHVEKEHLK
jgi:hypothetical protein